jgi:integrase
LGEEIKNQNHPLKGSEIVVSPIRETKDISSIKKLLKDNHRDLLLFTISINNGLRISDILPLKVKDLKNLKVGETLPIREKKTGKPNILCVNKSTHKVLREYLETSGLGDEDYLFRSRKGNYPLSVSSVNNLVKEWCRMVNIQGNYGTHSLRKTFGYIQRIKFGVSWEILCKRFNHSNQSVTMRYLGITDSEVNGILLNEI